VREAVGAGQLRLRLQIVLENLARPDAVRIDAAPLAVAGPKVGNRNSGIGNQRIQEFRRLPPYRIPRRQAIGKAVNITTLNHIA
jgi:hypothetical protein